MADREVRNGAGFPTAERTLGGDVHALSKAGLDGGQLCGLVLQLAGV